MYRLDMFKSDDRWYLNELTLGAPVAYLFPNNTKFPAVEHIATILYYWMLRQECPDLVWADHPTVKHWKELRTISPAGVLGTIGTPGVAEVSGVVRQIATSATDTIIRTTPTSIPAPETGTDTGLVPTKRKGAQTCQNKAKINKKKK
jgi:hypothetical protein